MGKRRNASFSSWTIREIEYYLQEKTDIESTTIRQLQGDVRKGVRDLIARHLKRQNNEHKIVERLHRLTQRERSLEAQGFIKIAGVDEAGRGPLAGPVVAAAVILDPASKGLWRHVDDSKKLSPQRRSELFDMIVNHALALQTAVIDAERIDRVNIYRASLEAMYQAVNGLMLQPDFILTDGFPIPGIHIPQEAIKGGDALCLSISAASIIAKVTRDRMMDEYSVRFQGYGFEKNKGYPTAEHRNAINLLGLTPIHRRSFSLNS